MIFVGIDTSICVETSLRDGFNLGYDVILISDATASGNREHYKTTLERLSDYYGLVMDVKRFKKAISDLNKVINKEIDLHTLSSLTLDSFFEEFNLLDPRTFALSTGS